MRVWLTAGVLVLLPALALAGDGIGDVASREAKKRAPKKLAPVFTDEDLQRRGDTPATAPAKPAEPASAAAPAAEEKPAVDPLEREREERRQLELRWRQRFADARLRLAVAEAGSWRETVRTEFYKGVPVQMKVREQVDTEALQQARQALAELQEEFRRTGLPPGWARE